MILLENCLCLARPRDEDLRGVDLLVEGKRIKAIGKGLAAGIRGHEVRKIDASRHLVIPGLVNAHHHFYQTLTRNLKAVQDAKLFDWLVYLYEIWKGIDEEAVYRSSLLAMAELLKTGCTCTTDHHYLYPEGFREDLLGIQFKAASELGMRFSPTRGSMSRGKNEGGLPPDSVVQEEDSILEDYERVADLYHNPAPDSMRRIALAPCSPFSVSERLMRETARFARKRGLRLHTHLAETNDEDEFCLKAFGRKPLKLMEDCEFIGPDVWYAHGIWFNDEELRLLAKTKTGVAHCPSSNMRLGSGVARVREMIDLGVPLSLAVDGSASNDSSDMLGELRQALLLQRVRYGSGGLSAREAFIMATEGGANMLGFAEAGALEPGRLADIALFDMAKLEYAGSLSDPLAALVFCGYNHGADYTIVNGEIVVEKGRLVGMDEETIRDKANEASRGLLAKAGSGG